MTDPPRLANYIQPPALSEARIQRQWARIAEQPSRPERGATGWYFAGLAIASFLVVLGLYTYQHRQPSGYGNPPAPLVVERDGAGKESLSLPEGLSIMLKDGESRYRVMERSEQRVHLQLERGTAEFEVTPGRKRHVVVSAAGFDVEVVGTHFEVALIGQGDQPDVAVRVQRGTVRVRPSGQEHSKDPIRTLSAGESWSTRTDVMPSPQPIGSISTGAPAESPVQGQPSSGVGSGEPPVPTPATTASNARPPSAKELFETAETARIKGRAREAASALDRLRHAYPSDPRAGLACFELGRLRMDQLGEPAGAVSALSDALRLDPSARFREDAQARLVQLYHRMGQLDRCRKAQSEYEARYPSGPHAKGVASLCH